MKASDKIVDFIKIKESLHDGDLDTIGLQPKLCPRGYWTEGYGSVIYINNKPATHITHPTLEDILPFSKIHTEEQAEERLWQDIINRSRMVNKLLKVKVTQNQFDALLSHYYNCGYSETMYRLVNSKACDCKLEEWFTKHYIKSGGVELRGLIIRRKQEWDIFKHNKYVS